MKFYKDQEIILYTEQLSIGYGKGIKAKIILDNLNLTLKRGELVCILGPNGVGKSTLLRTLSKVQRPLEGHVYIHSKPIDAFSRSELARNISLVLTERVSAGNMTVHELVALGRYPHTNWSGQLTEQDEDKIKWAIKTTNTNHLAGEKVFELSDGQVQKVMIARALAQDGDIMILDEPTAHLDLNNRLEIMTLLKSLASTTGKAVLVSTHELELALQTADKFWLAQFNMPIVRGVPEDLVLNGAVTNTFFNEETSFDINTGRFKVNHNYHTKIILEGGGFEKQWTAYALEREGFKLVNADITDLIARVFKKGQEIIWEVNDRHNQERYASIEELINGLKTTFSTAFNDK